MAISTDNLSPDEQEQLKELLDHSPEAVDDFLKKYFPKQYQATLRKQQRQAALQENVEYEILDEGDGFIEFEAHGRRVRLERQQPGAKGRKRANPYIDTREVNRMSVALRETCYAVAIYKLRKDGEGALGEIERLALVELKKRIFSGRRGIACLTYLVDLVGEVEKHVAHLPGGFEIDTTRIITRSLSGVLVEAVRQELERSK